MTRNDGKNAEGGDTPQKAITPAQERCIALRFGQERLTDVEICKRLKISESTLRRWEKLPEYKARLAEIERLTIDQLQTGTIANKTTRLLEYDKDWKRKTKLRDKRAAIFSAKLAEALKEKPEEDLVCELELATGAYKKRQVEHLDPETGKPIIRIVEAVFDEHLDDSIRNLSILAAKETGGLTERHEVSGPGGKPIQVQAEIKLTGYSWGTVDDALKLLLELQQAGRLPRSADDCERLAQEMVDREVAAREGKPVPPISEPYIPALDALLPGEGK